MRLIRRPILKRTTVKPCRATSSMWWHHLLTLKPQATHAPPVQNRIENPQVEKGWQGVKPQDAEKLKKTIAEQNPPPKDLPKPTPFVNPQIGNKGQVHRISWRNRLSGCGCWAENAAQFSETWCAFTERECYSGCFAKCSGCRKEARST